MNDIRAILRRYKEDIAWWFRKRVTTFVIRHWAGILWTAFFLTFILLLATIFMGVPQWQTVNKIQYIGFGLAILFGLFTVLSLLVSITVLHSLRDLVPDYTHAGAALEKVIRNTRHNLYILTENPAFLQLLDSEALRKWLEALQYQIRTRKIKVTFAYINRADLMVTKFPAWADAIGKQLKSLKADFLNRDTFNVARNPDYSDCISLIPLKTSSIPFYIAIADGDVMGMFCHTIIYPLPGNNEIKDVRKSVIRGFLSYDQNIVTALKSVFLKFLQLNASVYEYTCGACNQKSYKFDHNLLFTTENLGEAPQITCDAPANCGGTMTGELKELICLPAAQRNELYQQVTREKWQD